MRSVLSLALALTLLTACNKSDPPKEDPAPPPSATASATPSASAATSAAPSASASAEPAPSATPAAASASAAATTKPAVSAGAKPAASVAGPADGAGVCGPTPLPPCPLQGWMKTNTAPAMAAKDFGALATAFQKIQTFAPAGYTNWASISKDGAAAAQAQNLDAVKAACRGCHEQYKTKYKTEMRIRPLP